MSTLTKLVWMSALLGTALALHTGICLLRNFQKARRIGIPIRVMPISSLNPLWMLLDTKVLSRARRLPGRLGDNSFTRYNWRGWELADRGKSHQEMGDAFIIVTPGRNTLYIANPNSVVELLRRSKDFPHDAKLTGKLLHTRMTIWPEDTRL